MTRGLIVVIALAIGCREREHKPPPPPVAQDVDPLDTLRWDPTPLDWSRPIAAKTRDLSGYAGSLACKQCHEPLYATFAKHSMASA